MLLPTTAHLLFPLMAAFCFLSSSQQQLPALWVTQPFPVPVCHLTKANKKKGFPEPASAAPRYTTYLVLPGFFTRNLLIFLWFLCHAVAPSTNATTLYQTSHKHLGSRIAKLRVTGTLSPGCQLYKRRGA